MKTLDDLFKKPETFKEKLEDLWYDISYYYPSRLKEFWYGVCRFLRNIRRYREILWSDNDFDFGYLDNILMTKISFMADYFRTARIIEGEERIYQEINLALRVGKIAFEWDIDKDGEAEDYKNLNYTGYVNTRNRQRYWPQISEENFMRHPDQNKTYLRRLKARDIFFKILSRYSSTWWD